HGLLSFYLMNIVHMQAGEGIFQRARLPHAYLRGQNIELMAASNNVLRAGLTPKHIDLPELLRIIDAEPVHPAIIPPPSLDSLDPYTYPAPVDDYTLATARLPQGEALHLQSREATIVLNLDGKLRLRADGQQLELLGGEAAFLTPATDCELTTHGEARFVIASNH
ncbi:MAG: mannose-6-phosphate isomerase, class I, partial [Cardiobacterium sp.]